MGPTLLGFPSAADLPIFWNSSTAGSLIERLYLSAYCEDTRKIAAPSALALPPAINSQWSVSALGMLRAACVTSRRFRLCEDIRDGLQEI